MTFFFFFKWWLLRKNCLKFSLLRDRDLKLPPLVPFSLSNSHSCSQQIHNLVISSRNIRGKGWVSVRSHCSKVKMNVKTRNENFFYNWTFKIIPFILFGKQMYRKNWKQEKLFLRCFCHLHLHNPVSRVRLAWNFKDYHKVEWGLQMSMWGMSEEIYE